jgi:uroporphyrinogen III methyltransferase/synthase
MISGTPRVLVTRPRAQARDLVAALESWGARAVLFPTVEILAPRDSGPLDRAIVQLADYQWLVFTSANAVEAVFDRLGAAPRPLCGPRIAAVGPATAAEIRRRGGRVDFVPSEFLSARLGEELPDVDGQRILVPQGDQAGPDLVNALIKRRGRVQVVEAYRTAPPEQPDPRDLADLAVGVDAVVFTSGSAVRHLFALLGNEGAHLALKGAVIACIGPVTAGVARALGLEVHVEPLEHTVPAVAEALRVRLAA